MRNGAQFAEAELSLELRRADPRSEQSRTRRSLRSIPGAWWLVRIWTSRWTCANGSATCRNHNSLRVLAEQTGGIAVINTNDFDKALRRMTRRPATTTSSAIFGRIPIRSSGAGSSRNQAETLPRQQGRSGGAVPQRVHVRDRWRLRYLSKVGGSVGSAVGSQSGASRVGVRLHKSDSDISRRTTLRLQAWKALGDPRRCALRRPCALP